MTKTLLVLILMAVLVFVLNFVFGMIPMIAGYSLPLALFLGISLGFYIYTLIDNRIG
ncbi:hypothetical protein [Lacicoccus qingdaonensis]|uniref:Uncharacterized protein n=1 Tax=Lacicoccus qingdaonensis TaxID=576118 RepID=A0A1G9B9R9_9BACL|nr:hypothetical protein [Salinicoccus qingdaonensis]SDK36268.1 hypothetical protein SAMN05216216_102174 [Salinicoccus qingdaonensis]